MRFNHVDGEDKGKIILFALSTCGWCKKTKNLLNELGVAYDYVFVDQLDGDDKDKAREIISKWNPKCSYPTMVLNDSECIVGFDEDKIEEVLG